MPDPYVLALAKFAEKLADLLKKIRGEKIRRNNDAAIYFESLAAAMTRVLDALRDRRVPRIDGHEMETLIRAFPEKTKGVLDGSHSIATKASLDEVAKITRTLDGHYILHQPAVEVDREQMLRQIERIIGNCKGLAGVIKASP